MPAAMIAVVRKSERRVLLDPAFMDGDALTCEDGDEVRMLRMSQHGHMAEQATVVARMLRRAGWRVSVRDCEDLPPRPVRVVGRQPAEYGLTPDMLTRAALRAGTDLLDRIGAAKPPAAQPKKFTPPKPLPPPVEETAPVPRPPGGYYRCRVCQHVTYSRSVPGHVRLTGHDDWERVAKTRGGEYAPARGRERSPEAQEAPPEAPNQRDKGFPNPSRRAALQAPPDGSTP